MRTTATRYPSVLLAAALTLFGGVVPAAHAQSAKPPKKQAPAAKKPAAKTPPKKATGPVVLGTTQMAGDFGQVGTTYTIGKAEPINFTLKSAEYTTLPLTIDRNTWVPQADQKLLVLHYTVHNPLPREQGYDWHSIRFTAVDAKDTNHDYIQAIGREGTRDRGTIVLKPAQKLDVYCAIMVPAQGVVPKLIVEREKNAPVIRYDMRGKVTPLAAPIADPADTTGATALGQVPAKPGEFYTTGAFDVRLDAVAYTTVPKLGRRELPKGHKFLTVTFTLKNRTNRAERYYWGDWLAELKDADGEKVPYTQTLLKATRDEIAQGEVEPGEEVRVRFFFPLPEDTTGKTLKLAEGRIVDQRKARAFVFDLTAAPAQTATAN